MPKPKKFMKNIKNCEYFHKNCTNKPVYFPEIQNTININIETVNVDFMSYFHIMYCMYGNITTAVKSIFHNMKSALNPPLCRIVVKKIKFRRLTAILNIKSHEISALCDKYFRLGDHLNTNALFLVLNRVE